MIRQYRTPLFIQLFLLTILSVLHFTSTPRSIYRPTKVPRLTTRWVDEDTRYHFQHHGLEQPAIFDQYDADHFQEWLLPDHEIAITTDDAATSVPGTVLKQQLEELLQALRTNQQKEILNRYFIVLKDRDYNKKTRSGLMVLRYKNYPFVVKLFMETPQSFVSPFSKGFEPCCFFVMSGGTSRYLLGFTRVKNREAISAQIAADAAWNNKIIIPRKWFWQPQENRWFEVTSTQVGTEDRTIKLPGIYAIICDAMDAEPLSMWDKDDRAFGMTLSHLFDGRIDSHINNFLVDNKTGNIVIIDTEHFATQVGLRTPMTYDNYFSWYWQLSTKCIGNAFFRTKKDRTLYQTTPPPIIFD